MKDLIRLKKNLLNAEGSYLLKESDVFDSGNYPEYKVIEAIRKFIDPAAFVAGGRAMQLYMGSPTNDIDIFLTSPFNFNRSINELLNITLKRELGLEVTGIQNTRYGELCELVGTVTLQGITIQFIHYVAHNGIYYECNMYTVLNSFDLSICQVATEYTLESWGGTGVIFLATEAFKATIGNKIITLTEGLSDYQFRKTMTKRLPSYQKRFPDYSFQVGEPSE